MNKYKKRYQKIVASLVKKSFPEMKGKVVVFGFMSRGYFGFAFGFLPFFNFLGLNYSKLDKVSEKIIRGIVVHELCHFSIYENRGIFSNFRVFLLYWFSSKVRRGEEEITDKLAIEKGFGRYTYESTRFIEKFLKKFSKESFSDNYMSSEEIKAYAKMVGKW